VGLYTGTVDICCHGGPQGVGDIAGFHGDSSTAAILGGDGRRCLGAVEAQMLDAPYGCTDGAAEGISTLTMDHLLPTFAILLIGECVRHQGGCLKIGRCSQHCVDASCTNTEAYVLHTEKCIVSGGAGVLAWAKEEEKRDRYHVCDGLFVIFSEYPMGEVQDVNYDEDRNRLDP
jgi:hypothetical protein